ncbi:MAG: ISL3 family transposase [Cyanobacteria bacterium P01_C01_bin.120]
MDAEAGHLTFNVFSTQTTAQCPLCGSFTGRVHSRYERTLADLPCVHFKLTLLVTVSKFFCSNPTCHRRIFTERLPKVAAPWARKTVRLVQHLQAIGLALGGAAGARLGLQLGYWSCGSTLLNHLQSLPLPSFDIPKVLGVDNFAFRKGHNYGTILVDLETHQPIALLPDRKAETLVTWLKAHPGIEVLSRDRSKTYRSAMNEGAPEAIQVADRFHLVKNLGEALEQAFGSYRSELKAAEQSQHPGSVTETPEKNVLAMAKPTATEQSQQRIRQNQHHKRAQQKIIKALRVQGWTQATIAQEVGVSLKTVERYSRWPDFPETPARRSTFGRSVLDPYKPQLLEWWNQGIREPSILMKLLAPCGFEGSLRTLQRYICGLREAQGLPPVSIKVNQALPKVVDPQTPPFTPRQAAYLVLLRPENRQAEETDLLEQLAQQHEDLAQLIELADEFLELLRKRQADVFDDWLMKAAGCTIKPLKTFVKGLFDDYAAVKASLMSEVNNGPVEGLNNKLKMLKRQMYGRASLELLEKRLVMAA